MGTLTPAEHTGTTARLTTRIVALLAAAAVTLALLAAPAAAHTVGPQATVGSTWENCLASGEDGAGDRTIHLHDQNGDDAGAPGADDIDNSPCVQTQGGFFASRMWTFILSLCVAAAALLFVAAIGKGASAMMRGQGAGLGQAVKSVLPLILMAALFGAIATLPVLLIPLVSAILNLVLTGVGALIPS